MMGKRQYRQSISIRPEFALWAAKIASARGVSRSALVEAGIARLAEGVEPPTVAEVEAFKLEIEERKDRRIEATEARRAEAFG